MIRLIDILLVGALAGCHLHVLEQSAGPSPATVQWQRDITVEVNDHEARLDALEGVSHASETPVQ